ncbi:MAG: DUF3995 domain-containing protein [Devosia sp.]
MTVVAMVVAALIFVPLLAAGLAHLVWSTGLTWPLRDRDLLFRTVVGRAGGTVMPNRFLTLIVSLCIFAAGVFALSLADPASGGVLLTLVGVVLAAVFLARGIIGFTPGWRSRFPVEPFATYDRRLYSPLILAIGIGFLILVILRLL